MWLSSSDLQEKMTNFLAEAGEITITAVSVLVCVLFCIQISANMRRSHLLSAFGYVKCAGR